MNGPETNGRAAPNGPLRASPAPAGLRRVLSACERFEAGWRAALLLGGGPASRPRVEDALAGLSGPERGDALQLMLDAERRFRRGLGEEPKADEYLARFPAEAEAVRVAFAPGEESDTGLARPDDPDVVPTDQFAGVWRVSEVAWTLPTEALPPWSGDATPTDGPPPEPTEAGTIARYEGPTEPFRDAAPPEPVPRTIGRYVVMGLLGEGGFGRVYQAWDDALGRDVAIKVPRAGVLTDPTKVAMFLREARSFGSMKHPAIVTVHDVGLTGNGTPFLVLEYVPGKPLSTAMRADRLDRRKLAKLLVGIAGALQHAHVRGFVHRDLKPENLLVDAEGHPHVADFGLALGGDVRRERGREVAGTPPYMAPEQVRGESHRIEPRTDIWGLGVVFYQMLTGRLPFQGSSREALFGEILGREPVPPRRVDATIPVALERVCLKCLSKRMSGRYESARAFAADLEFWLMPTATAEAALPPGARVNPSGTAADGSVMPKGLRPFDAADAGYLALLPGPSDRDGLPACLGFWKARIEATEPADSFPVGLLYGPTGCGKTSLVRAGLIPRLAGHVRSVYLEASPGATESDLLRGLRRACPGLAPGLTPAEAIQGLREGPVLREGRKLLVVIDQFEQWLHARRPDQVAGSDLVASLRQCDGAGVQALLLVRDDFGMAVVRFMAALEVPLVEGKNFAALDRFDVDHAAAVLGLFGRALGKLPVGSSSPSVEAARFLDRAARSLAETEGGKVSPVRLAVFAEMFRGKAWTTASLRKVGGAAGIGVPFLEEALGSGATDPRRRMHRDAARDVLRALLPEPGTDIRARPRTYDELLAASHYDPRSGAFDDLLSLLDGELRLITPRPTDPGDPAPAPVRAYMLTHDYLVTSLRAWLRRTQTETTRGRAELLLEARAAVWSAQPEQRYLPSTAEWTRIELLTRRRDWTPSQALMIQSAARHYRARLAAGCVAAALLVAVMIALLGRVERNHRKSRVSALFTQLIVARPDHVPALLERLDPDRDLWRAKAQALAKDPARPPRERANATLALARRDGNRVGELVALLLTADPPEFAVIADALTRWRRLAVAPLWAVLDDPASPRAAHLRAAALLVGLDPDDGRWGRVAPRVARALTAEGPSHALEWAARLDPLRSRLDSQLSEAFADRRRPESERLVAAEVLATYVNHKDPSRLSALLTEAEADQFRVLLPYASLERKAVLSALRAAFARPEPLKRFDRESNAWRRVNTAAALVRLGEPGLVWPLLGAGANISLRTWLVHRMPRLGVEESTLLDRLRVETDPLARQALLLALGEASGDGDPPGPDDADPVGAYAEGLYRDDPDAAVHSAAEWVLRVRGRSSRLASLRDALRGVRRTGWGWSVDAHGQTFVHLRNPGPFSMGTPEGDPMRLASEAPHRRRLGHGVAVMACEVTAEAFRRCDPGHVVDPAVSPEDDGPATNLTWYEAARYCRWLDDREGLPEDQKCYPPLAEIRPGMRLPADFLARRGHRLPTEAEWELCCRGGTPGRWFFGDVPVFLAEYAWYSLNADDRVHSVGLLKPNAFGFFDVYGNAQEWCQDAFAGYPTNPADPGPVAAGSGPRVVRGGHYLLNPRYLRSASRASADPAVASQVTGVRVARTLAE